MNSIDAAVPKDGEYLWEDTSNHGGTYGAVPFSKWPNTTWVAGNDRIFDSYGSAIEERIWGIRAVVTPGIVIIFNFRYPLLFTKCNLWELKTSQTLLFIYICPP